MKVIVDTSIWSIALRRSKSSESSHSKELRNLISAHLVEIIGPIRQELLSGVREEVQFQKLEKKLNFFPDSELTTADYIMAARFFNLCRTKGIQGSNTDFLICAVAVNRRYAIYTTDKDFNMFSKYIPIDLYKGVI